MATQSNPVIINVYLTKEGAERIAKGDKPYDWEIVLTTYDKLPSSGAVWLKQNVEIPLPSPAEVLPIAMGFLKEKMQSIKAQAYVDTKEVQERMDNLLALTYTPQTPADDEPEVIVVDDPDGLDSHHNKY